MAIHKVGNFKVEVLHEQHLAEKRVDVLIVVYKGREFLDLARFDFKGFNSGDLRRQLPALSEFYVQKLRAVIEDAREWPKIGDGEGRPGVVTKAKEQAGRKAKSRRSLRRKRK